RAFKNTPKIDYKELAKKAVDYARGVPLALITLGSSLLTCKSKEEWEDELNKLKQFPDENIQRVLRLSNDRLGKNDKEIFLDIACFHKGKHVEYVKKMLGIRGFYAETGIKSLIDASLISIDSAQEIIEMHDLIQEMGCTIVHEQCIEDPSKRNRLFNSEDVYHVLEKFKVMFNLKMLIVVCSKHFGNYSTLSTSLDLPNSLRYLYWYRYPLESLPSNFSPENLVELHMPYSRVKQLWKEDKRLVNLEVINLHYSSDLTEVPNLSGSPKIGHINLHGCENLVEIPSYFQHLDKLTYHDLGRCTSCLISLPNSLRYLHWDRYPLKSLPSNFSPENLVELHMPYSRVKHLWKEDMRLVNLKVINLQYSSDLIEVPNLSRSKKIGHIYLRGCESLVEIPSYFQHLDKLTYLDLGSCKNLRRSMIGSLPKSIKQASRLYTLRLIGCKWLQSLPELPIECSLRAHGCTSLKTVSSSRTTHYTQGRDEFKYFGGQLDFSNCRNLDHNARSNIMDYAQLRIMQVATASSKSREKEDDEHDDYHEYCSYWPSFSIECPGKEIPNWFSYQSEESSVNIELRQDWFRTGLLGFALAIVVSCELNCQLKRMEIGCRPSTTTRGISINQIPILLSYPISTLNDYFYDQHHVFLWNEVFKSKEVAKKCSPDFCNLANEASVEFCLVDEDSGEPTSYMKVEKWGTCPLYAEDASEEEEEEEVRHHDFEASEPVNPKTVDQVKSLKKKSVEVELTTVPTC
ncbi:disease resistance protein RPP4-like, partial [Malus sylvestris]|uniref:disease resistance protein RPP4-like n=1 Tax=Malus sylvestris TaxID=3752 RepID=UPI0021AC512F